MSNTIRIREIQAKSALVRSSLPDADMVVNPYVGCQFACAYCYASFMGRFAGEAIAEWGRYVHPKINAVELFGRELARLRARGRAPSILLSSVTDPYQGLESRYRLTRGILEALAREPYPGRLCILTKSPLVLRDLDLFGQLPNFEVGVTVTTDDDRLGRELEVHAPAASARLSTLEQLARAGIETYAFIGPLLPSYADAPALLERLVERLAATGVRSAYVEHLNPSRYILARIQADRPSEPGPGNVSRVRRRAIEARAALEALLLPLLDRHGIRLRLGQALVHADGPSAPQGAETTPQSGKGTR